MTSDEKEIGQLPEDESWVFESLVNFLHGPLWKLPVFGFIEEKSVVFDPDSYNEMSEDREIEFHKIHEEYKALVDFMLGSFMEDLEVTPEQVEHACRSRDSNTSTNQDSQVTKIALQQLSAAEDFGTFRRLMTRKNIDLQLQSLELLVSKYGVLSPSLGDTEEGEDDFLELVLRYTEEASKLDADFESQGHQGSPLHSVSVSVKPEVALIAQTQKTPRSKSSFEEFDRLKILPTEAFVEAVIETETIGQSSTNEDGKEIDQFETIEKNQLEPLEKNQWKTNGKNQSDEALLEKIAIDEIRSTAPEQRKLLASVRLALDEEDPTIQKKNIPKLEEVGGSIPVTEEEIQRRREYMRNQRDKLVALKKKEREKQMAEGSGASASASRPKSGKAAAMALKTPPIITTTNEKSLAARRALANRLKQELQPQ